MSAAGTHRLKVQPPYFDALMDGSKTFEVRKNDRAFQRGDVLQLAEWHPHRSGYTDCWKCRNAAWDGHFTGREVGARVTFVYAGDPRFGGIEPGHVVLAVAVGVWRDDEPVPPARGRVGQYEPDRFATPASPVSGGES